MIEHNVQGHCQDKPTNHSALSLRIGLVLELIIPTLRYGFWVALSWCKGFFFENEATYIDAKEDFQHHVLERWQRPHATAASEKPEHLACIEDDITDFEALHRIFTPNRQRAACNTSPTVLLAVHIAPDRTSPIP